MSNVTPIKKQPLKRAWLVVNHDPDDIKKIHKRLGQEAINELEAMAKGDREHYLALLANHQEQTKVAQKRDPDVVRFSEKVSEARRPYRETLKGIDDRRAYVVWLMENS